MRARGLVRLGSSRSTRALDVHARARGAGAGEVPSEWIVRTQVADSFLFVTRPVSAVILLLSAAMVLLPIWKARRVP
jgi:hypothetical protein